MVDLIQQARTLSGVTTATVADITTRYGMYGIDAYGDTAPIWVQYWVAADLALWQGQQLIGTSGVTAVEDISVDQRRPVQSWWDLADRLRARGDELEADSVGAGPFVVPYGGRTSPEAVESWT